MLNVAVAKVSLQGPRIMSHVRQSVAAGVAEHVGMRLEAQLSLPACPFDHAGEASGAERCPAFRGEHEGRLGFLLALKSPQRPQFVPEDRMSAWGRIASTTALTATR
jgi:hypothetical protein